MLQFVQLFEKLKESLGLMHTFDLLGDSWKVSIYFIAYFYKIRYVFTTWLCRAKEIHTFPTP